MERPSVTQHLRFALVTENVVSLGTGETFIVRSTSHPEERAYLVFRSSDLTNWACSCPADHARLRDEGRYCSTIEKVRALP